MGTSSSKRRSESWLKRQRILSSTVFSLIQRFKNIIATASSGNRPTKKIRYPTSTATELLDWCRKRDSQKRLLMISEAIFPFEEERETGGMVFSAQALAILGAAQDPVAVLRCFASSVEPSSWWGSLADEIAKQRQPFEVLLQHERPDIRRAAQELVTWGQAAGRGGADARAGYRRKMGTPFRVVQRPDYSCNSDSASRVFAARHP